MSVQKKNNNIEEPVTAQAPTTPEVTTTAAETTETVTANGNSPDTLAGYLDGGYYRGAGKDRYTDPALVDQAEEIGKIFASGGLTITAFNRMQRTLKSAARLPYEAQQGAFKKVLTRVRDLENQKKAPPLLRKVIERNRTAVQTEADYAACLEHFRDIAVYLTAQAVSAGTPKK